MSKHTPGPWHIDGHEIHAGEGCEFVTTFNQRPDVGAANARLIAAAPDYDEVVRRLVEIAEYDDKALTAFVREELAPAARAAIAKVDGSNE